MQLGLYKTKSKIQIQKLIVYLKNEINTNVYLFYVPNFHILI